MAEALRGKVKWFNNAKGFGFIENGDGDVFVHYSVIESDGFRSLKDGDEVDYEIQRGPKGLQAVRVSKTKGLTDSVEASSTSEDRASIEAAPVAPSEQESDSTRISSDNKDTH